MAIYFDPPIEFTSRAADESVTFETSDGLNQWIDREESAWSLLLEVQGHRSQLLQATVNAQRKSLAQLRSTLESHSPENPETFRGTMDSAVQRLNDAGYLPSTSNGGKKVLTLLDQGDQDLALSTMRAFRKDQTAPAKYPEQYEYLLPGQIEAHLFQHGYSPDLRPFTLKFQELSDKYSRSLGEAEETIRGTKHQYVRFIGRSRLLLSGQSKRFHKALDNMENQSATRQEQHEKRMRHIEAQFKERMRLLGPVGYWDAKKKRHYRVAVGSGILFVILIASLFHVGFQQFSFIAAFLQEIAADNQAAWIWLLLFGFPAFLALWILRMVYRLFTTNVHLHGDASERVAMIQTFLALMEDPEKVDESDRILILQALFRPSSAPGQEEGTPPNWLDILLTRISGHK